MWQRRKQNAWFITTALSSDVLILLLNELGVTTCSKQSAREKCANVLSHQVLCLPKIHVNLVKKEKKTTRRRSRDPRVFTLQTLSNLSRLLSHVTETVYDLSKRGNIWQIALSLSTQDLACFEVVYSPRGATLNCPAFNWFPRICARLPASLCETQRERMHKSKFCFVFFHYHWIPIKSSCQENLASICFALSPIKTLAIYIPFIITSGHLWVLL